MGNGYIIAVTFSSLEPTNPAGPSLVVCGRQKQLAFVVEVTISSTNSVICSLVGVMYSKYWSDSQNPKTLQVKAVPHLHQIDK